jgi:hypothetical protein
MFQLQVQHYSVGTALLLSLVRLVIHSSPQIRIPAEPFRFRHTTVGRSRQKVVVVDQAMEQEASCSTFLRGLVWEYCCCCHLGLSFCWSQPGFVAQHVVLR